MFCVWTVVWRASKATATTTKVYIHLYTQFIHIYIHTPLKCFVNRWWCGARAKATSNKTKSLYTYTYYIHMFAYPLRCFVFRWWRGARARPPARKSKW